MAERFHYMEEVGGSSPTPAYQAPAYQAPAYQPSTHQIPAQRAARQTPTWHR